MWNKSSREAFSIEFRGAAKEVTGSMFIVRAENSAGKITFGVDCGKIQKNGNSQKYYQKNYNKLTQQDINNLDFILLTHAHLDHSGLIPHIFTRGYNKPIYATEETIKLSRIILADSGHIEEEDANYVNKKNKRANSPFVTPLYTSYDAVGCMSLFKPVKYGKTVSLFDDSVRFVFKDASHILGSAFIEVYIRKPDGNDVCMVFSGDIGSTVTARFSKNPDILVMESTYGGTVREPIDFEQSYLNLARIILKTAADGGKVLIPSFTVGRLQRLLFGLNQALRHLPPDESEMLSKIPFIIDSPMATQATEVFRELFENNPERLRYMLGSNIEYYRKNRINPFILPNLHFTVSVEESQALNNSSSPMVIFAGSGMCNAGRIKHHLKHNLWNPKNTVVFVGYQGQGTLGRKIFSGCKEVRIFGEKVTVNSQIESMPEFSSHADQRALLKFAGKAKTPPDAIFLVHGEELSLNALGAELEKKFPNVIIPAQGARYFLVKDLRLDSSPDNCSVETVNPNISDIVTVKENTVLILQKLGNLVKGLAESEYELAALTHSDMEVIRDSLHTVFEEVSNVRTCHGSLRKKYKKYHSK